MRKGLIFIALCFFLCTGFTKEEAIQQLEQKYVEAFNAQNVELLLSLWADDAIYLNAETGEQIQGKEEIKKAYEEYFQENPKVELSVQEKSLTFPNENEALEKGIANVTTPGIAKTANAYTVQYTKKGENWLIQKVSDNEEFLSTTHYDELQGLDWLVGDWVDKGDNFEVISRNRWDRYKNFLIQKFKVMNNGKLELEGQQIIGWDPAEEQIRSWTFDSDGGFTEGVWNKTESGWSVEYGTTLPDGGYGSSISLFTNISEKSFKWSSVSREIDGEMLPNIGPIEIIRKKK